jgi:hypothetical protein
VVQTKFGGQPDWIAGAAWPHASDGRPLVLLAQFVRESGECVYVFINLSMDAQTWEPLTDGSAVIVQPGPATCHLETRAHAEGPQLFDMHHRRYERIVVTEPGLDPEEWISAPVGGAIEALHGDWNKIGGTPLYLQGRETPPGDGWNFALQFTAGWAGRELGDGAECYVFTREDGSGAFLWQCH